MIDTQQSDYKDQIIAHRRLWKAVLMQQIMDVKSLSNKAEAKRNREEAYSWLYHGGKHFATVCDLMDMDPAYVTSKIKEASKQHYQWRKGDSGKAVKWIDQQIEKQIQTNLFGWV